MKKPVVIGLAVVVLAAVVAGGYWWYQSRQDNGLTLYGNVDIRTVNLSFRVGGRVESLAVDEGDAIKAGQVLGELDHKPYEIALMQAKAGVSVAQAQYDLMLAGYRDEEIAQAAAAVKQAQAAYDYAQNFYNRQQGLWKSRTISANDLENARSSRDQAQATLKSAQDKLRQYRSGNREQDIAQAKASLEQAQAQLAQNDGPENIAERVNQILEQALRQRASDIHIEPTETHLRIRLRVDGVLHALPLLAPELAAPVIARLKVLASLDIAEHRLPQDGQFALNLAGRPLSFRIATLPCRYGEKIVLRLLHQVDQALDLEALGLSSSQLAAFRQALNQPQGLLLVTGPTGSGKTVTLYSALQARNREQVNICSVEDPLEIPIAGMNQTQINPRAGLTFHSVLRALLRQDPDIVMVGEIRDAETAEIALKAAQTGHLVLSTLHTNSTSETLTRLQQMGIARWMISSALSLVIAQRLVRKLCPHCRRNAGSAADLPHSLWPRPLPRWQAAGCEHCYHGYYGRLALFEVLPVTPGLRQGIVQGLNAIEIESLARAAGMMTLFESGCQAIEQGLTSLEEVVRVLGIPHGD